MSNDFDFELTVMFHTRQVMGMTGHRRSNDLISNCQIWFNFEVSRFRNQFMVFGKQKLQQYCEPIILRFQIILNLTATHLLNPKPFLSLWQIALDLMASVLITDQTESKSFLPDLRWTRTLTRKITGTSVFEKVGTPVKNKIWVLYGNVWGIS